MAGTTLSAAGASLAQGTMAGRGSVSGAGVYEQITLGTNLSLSGTTLNAAGGVGGGVSVADEDSFILLPHGIFHQSTTSYQLTPTTRVFVTRMWIPFEFKFDQFIFYVTIAGTVDAVVYQGIYSNDGNTLHASGSVAATTSGEKTITLGSAVTLSGGYYLYALGAESTGNLPYVQAMGDSAQIFSAINTACASGAIGYGANTISGSALPATVGAITTTNSDDRPWVVLGGST